MGRVDDIYGQIGRDLKHAMEDMFALVIGVDDPKVFDLICHTELYTFMAGPDTFSWGGANSVYHARRTPELLKNLLNSALNEYLILGIISPEKFDNLQSMLESEDMENVTVVASLIEFKYRPLWLKTTRK